MTRTTFRTCHLCETNCGLKIEVDGDQIVSVRPDEDDVFSKGFICPKGAALGEIHHDPDRLKQPVRRNSAGGFDPISWDEAFDIVQERLLAIRRTYGANAIGLYVGNPVIHHTGALLLNLGLINAIGSKNVTSASSQDTSTRFAASYYLYGSSLGTPIPDLAHTDYFLCIGANPRVSNGSMLTAPDMRGRLREIQSRGGKVVVVDPRRTETARDADEHISIRPGSDAHLLFAMINHLVRAGMVDRARVMEGTRGWPAVEKSMETITPEAAAPHVGVAADDICRWANEFARAQAPVAYSRVGVCNNEFGTLASFATDLLNIATGRMGVQGGSLFPAPMIDATAILKMTGGDGHARWHSRVRKLPETMGTLPATILAEEMETAGPGQVRALMTFAGNPVLSTPNGNRLRRALGGLDFMVSVDPYINETTKHAHIILPPCSSLTEEFVDVFASRFALRTIGRSSPPVVEGTPGEWSDWKILLEINYRLGGGPTGIGVVDAFHRWARHLGFHWTPESAVDLLIRSGRHGDRWLPWSNGWNLAKLRRHPHGIDLGEVPLGIKHGIHHRDGRIHVDDAPILAGISELASKLGEWPKHDELLLIGKRELRSNNSWLHNVPSLMSGKERCFLIVHSEDAQRLGLKDGGEAMMTSRVHRGKVPVRVSDEMRPGVVCMPHGWGHQESAPWQQVAGSRPGYSVNDWTDDQQVESIVGQSILNGVVVRLEPAPSTVRESQAPEILAQT